MIFGNLGNMAEMVKQAQKLQGDLKKVKDNLKNLIYSAEINGVKVTANGDMEVTELKITQQMDNKKMEDSVKQAVNRALNDAKKGAADQLKGVTGGLSIPGIT